MYVHGDCHQRATLRDGVFGVSSSHVLWCLENEGGFTYSGEGCVEASRTERACRRSPLNGVLLCVLCFLKINDSFCRSSAGGPARRRSLRCVDEGMCVEGVVVQNRYGVGRFDLHRMYCG